MPPNCSESDLLASRDPSATLGPFDAKAAAIIKGFLFTTPNQDVIRNPSPTREVYLRSDFRFGPHDPTLWPQPYVPDFCHLGAIPSKPMADNPLSIMWWNPSHGDFISSGGGVVDGLGKLSSTRYAEFRMRKSEIGDRVARYRRSTPNPNVFVVQLETTLGHISTRLQQLRTSFPQMAMVVTEFQRCFLELHGLLDYLEIYKPRMEGIEPPATIVAPCVGAITVLPQTLQDFYRAGIPIWYVQPCRSGPFPHNVLNVVTPFEPDQFLCLDKPDPPSPVIYDGYSNLRDRYDAYYRFLQTRLVFKDPFECEELSTTTRRSTTSKGRGHVLNPSPNQSAGRDKFLPLESPLAPFSIPVWSTALQAVDRSPSRLAEAYIASKHFGHYTFPDPGLFVTPVTSEKKTKLIETWLGLREAWIVRTAQEGSLAMSGQRWRDLLATDLSGTSRTDTKAATRRQNILEMIKPSPELKMRTITGQPLIWQGNKYPPNALPPENIVREILWEVFELNFTHELLALDRRACKDLDLLNSSQLFDRQDLISKCFLGGTFQNVSIPTSNCGLAANSIQDRLPYITNFVRVMQSWTRDKPAIFSLANRSPSDISSDQGKQLEEAATKYYCQEFFNHFGRAAQIPHRLFQ